MVKRKSILIMGVVLLGIVSALGATLALLGTGVVGGSAQPLVFASASVEVEYTGNAVTSDKFEITSGKLKDGHTAYADMSGTQTEAGTSDNAFTITVLDERGNDVTDEYEFDCVYGKLTVLPRKLELKSGDGSKVYDGTELKIESATVADGTLAAGNELVYTYVGGITKWGEAENVFSARVIDSKKRDVTANYAITYGYGKLTVTKRKISVTTQSAEKQYDGTPLTADGCDVSEGSLADGHEIELNTTGTITAVGVAANTFEINIRDAKGETVTENYEITPVRGTLTVTKRKISIATESAEKQYDGTPLTADGCIVTGGSLADGHEIELDTTGTITDVGTAANTFGLNISDADGNPAAENYEITSVLGTLTVTKRKISIATESAEKQYDGTPLTAGGGSVTDGSLADGHNIVLTVTGTITDIGSTGNTFDAAVINADGRDVTRNYEITSVRGTLTVTKRILTIVTASAKKQYDGTSLVNRNYTVTQGSLLAGHVISLSSVSSRTDAGIADNLFEISVMDVGADASEYYEIRQETGVLEVVPAIIIVQTKSASKVYDGSALTSDSWRVRMPNRDTVYSTGGQSIGLYKDDLITVALFGTQTIAGSSDNDCVFRGITRNGEDVSKNYEIRYSLGILTVTRRPITVTSANASKVYDGTPLQNTSWNAAENVTSDTKVVAGESISVKVTGSRTEIGESANTISEVTITKGGVDLTANYDILRAPGYLLITSGKTMMDDPAEPPDIVTLRLFSYVDNSRIYLRSGSYGEYNGHDFDAAREYTGAPAMSYLPTDALARGGKTPINVTIDLVLTDFMLPYFAVYDNELPQPSDVRFDSDKKLYDAAYYSYDYLSDNGAYIKGLAAASDEEIAYRAFVKQNYLSVPDSTRAYLDRYITENGINRGSATLIGDVAEVVKNSAEYKYMFPAELNEADDLVVAFLRDIKQGVCRHYAAAATLIYRTLGYPARYTNGYVGNTAAGKWVDIKAKNAHAWVEVYIDGVGWIPVEVTGASFDDSGDGNGGGAKPSVDDNTVKPVDCFKMYDGTPLTPRNEVQGLTKYTAMGYTYTVSVSGSQTDIGYGSSVIDRLILRDRSGAVVLDKNGDDITCYESDMKNLAFGEGRLHVYEYEISVSSGSDVKTYDGTPLYCDKFTVTDGAENLALRGHTLSVSGFTKHKGVGSVYNLMTVKVLQGDEDVSVRYHVNYDYGTLTVNAVEFTVRAGSRTVTKAELDAMGGTLTCDEYSLFYNGVEMSFEEIAEACGLDNFTVEVKISGSQSKLGSADNIVESVTVRDGNGENVTSLFRITDEVGKLVVRR